MDQQLGVPIGIGDPTPINNVALRQLRDSQKGRSHTHAASAATSTSFFRTASADH
jgi:hypothetical protein